MIAVLFDNNTEDIKTIRFVRDIHQTAVGTRCLYDVELFIKINGCFGLGDLDIRTGFNFNERQREWGGRFIVGNDINFTEYLPSTKAIIDRGNKVRYSDSIAMRD